MIAKAKSIAHGGNAADYALKKKEAEIIDKRMIVGNTGKEIAQEFKTFQNLNHATKNNSISFVLSPEPNEGKELTNAQYRKLADEFLKRMGLEDHQAIVVKHKDKDHTHLHIIANRINAKGEAYKDNFISKKSQTKAHELARDYGLTSARDVQQQTKEQTKEIRKEIKAIHDRVIKSNPKTLDNYVKKMKSKGVEMIPTINKSGKLQGYRVAFKDFEGKASQVHAGMGFSKLQKSIKLAIVQERKRDLGRSFY